MNIDLLRSDTPGCRQVMHFNNAGCSLPVRQVLDAIQQYQEAEALYGGYEIADREAAVLNEFYTAIAAYLNTRPENIAFANSATDAYMKALSSIPFEKDDVILTSKTDYVSNQIQFLSLEKRFGIKIIHTPNNKQGEIDVELLRENIERYHPKLIAITHVPNNSGIVQPVEAIGELCKEYDIYYAIDACQSAGQMPLDVRSFHCDFLSATMRKFMRGPRGTGFLFVSDKVLRAGLEPLFIDMRGAEWNNENFYQPQPDAKRFEYVEQPYSLLRGATVAVQYLLQTGIDNIFARDQMLAEYTRKQLKAIPGVQLMDRGTRQCNIITLHVEGISIFQLKGALQRQGINTSAAAAKHALIDFREKQIEGALRISPHYYNTTEEIDRLAYVLFDLVRAGT